MRKPNRFADAENGSAFAAKRDDPFSAIDARPRVNRTLVVPNSFSRQMGKSAVIGSPALGGDNPRRKPVARRRTFGRFDVERRCAVLTRLTVARVVRSARCASAVCRKSPTASLIGGSAKKPYARPCAALTSAALPASAASRV